MLNRETYQPTPADIATLQKLGLTLEEVFSFDGPTDEQMQSLSLFGMTLIDTILHRDVKRNIIDALAQVSPLRYPFRNREITQGELTRSQENFIEVVQIYIEGNPYMGQSFTREQALEILTRAKESTWIPQNFNEQYDQLMKLATSA